MSRYNISNPQRPINVVLSASESNKTHSQNISLPYCTSIPPHPRPKAIQKGVANICFLMRSRHEIQSPRPLNLTPLLIPTASTLSLTSATSASTNISRTSVATGVSSSGTPPFLPSSLSRLVPGSSNAASPRGVTSQQVGKQVCMQAISSDFVSDHGKLIPLTPGLCSGDQAQLDASIFQV